MATFIIAEAGVNHNGELKKALELIDVASEIGADAIKFQTFNASNMVVKNAPKARYQELTTEKGTSQFDMLSKLQLSKEDHHKLLDHSKEKNIRFLSTAFDEESLRFILEHLKVELLKIPSGEITNGPFLLEHAKTQLNIILSTGMSNLEEVELALSVLAFGYLYREIPSKEKFLKTYQSNEGRKILKEKVTLLHCTSQYPADISEINLNAIKTMKEKFNLRVGYSDHTQGILASCNAIMLGAEVIEKHFTLDKNLPGPDHSSSLDPQEMDHLVKSIRLTEKSLGDGLKQATHSEKENKIVVRKSIVAKRKIKEGELFSSDNITQKRPGTGKSPMEYWDLINKPSKRDYSVDDLIEK